MSKLLTTPDAAEFLGIMPNTLTTWRIQGKGPEFIKIGRLVRYQMDALQEYLQNQTRRNTCKNV